MAIGIRTSDLVKTYTSPPPLASGLRPGATGIVARRRATPRQKLSIKALDGLTLEVRPGEIFGLLGPNGAGKSTTVGVLTTRVRPTSGEAWIGDRNVWRDRVAVKRLIGVVPQRPNLDFNLTAREILVFHGAYFGIPAARRRRTADELLDRFKLTERADQLALGFSGGMMQRLSIARAMAHDPEVLFLDEPSAGLDPQTRLLLWEIIREYNRAGRTILLTTHNMEEADGLCDRVAIIDHGRLIALGTPEALKRSIPGGYIISLRFDGGGAAFLESLGALEGVTQTRVPCDGSVDLYADTGGPLIPQVVARATTHGASISDVHIAAPSLENLFLHHTGRSLRE